MDDKTRKIDYVNLKVYFDSLFNNFPEAIVIVDQSFKVLNINKVFKEIFQYDLFEVENKDLTEILCERILYDASYNFRETIINGKFVKEELRRKRKDGSILDVLLQGFPIVIEGQIIGAYCIYSDISETKEKEKQIKILAYNDVLTGLFNRDFFLDNLDYEVYKNNFDKNNQEKFAVLILNINEFKDINHALGHLAGEQILKEYALRLRNSIQFEDIVARFNEHEFAILIPKIKDIGGVMEVVNGIKGNLGSCFFIDNNEFQIATNIGVAIYPDDSIDSIELVRKAYVAMNKSKEFSVNNIIRFEKSLDKEVQEYFWMKNDLAKSIYDEEFFINYQPIYDTITKRIVGVEALIRWNHRGNGIISPAKFIPIAEKTGMIHSIGEWVLLNACNQNRRWQGAGYESIYVSVNISILQLEQSDFCEKVKRILKESKLDPRYLQLEITETFFTQNYELVENVIKEISDLGIKLSIDDFGTGYSSLEKLCELNISNLKIDRMFIDGVNENINKSKIVKAVISLAESLNISLIAEGVETEEELSFLKENRCTVVQGYLFSRPVDTLEIEKMLVKSER